jgi:hypothetical protein
MLSFLNLPEHDSAQCWHGVCLTGDRARNGHPAQEPVPPFRVGPRVADSQIGTGQSNGTDPEEVMLAGH